MSVEFQLGVMIGEYILNKYLPTINVECQSNHIINVSDDEEKEYNRFIKLNLDIDRKIIC